MKIIIRSLILIIIFLSAVELPLAEGLRSVHTGDGINIWAGGLNGYLIESTDAGNTWRNRSPAGGNLNSVFAINNFVFAAGDGGMIFRSSDNGGSFSSQNISGGVKLNSIFMIDANTGWVVGNSGIVYKTVNSGMNWSTQASNTADNLYSIKFADSQTGFSCGSGGRVIKTTNGGLNWSALGTPALNDLLTIDVKGSVIFSFGTNSTGISSTNSGNSWVLVDYNILTRQDINSVCMLSQTEYYSCGGGGFIRRTTNAGAAFEFQVNPILAGLNSIFFYNSSLGFAAGIDNNIVLKTTNGGLNWITPNGMTQSLTWETKLIGSGLAQGNTFGYSPLSRKTIYCGSGSTVYRSFDEGDTWAAVFTVPTTNTINAVLVNEKDTNLFLVSSCTTTGKSDNILRTTNYGVNWSVSFNDDFENDSKPINIDPNHPDTVYLCVKNSFIYRSTNFGLTWASTGPTILGRVCILKVQDGNSANIFCGVQMAPSKIYRSTNYAVTWSVADSIDAFEVPHIEGSNLAPGILYASALYYGIKKSTNSGANWNTIALNIDAWGLDVAKDDPNVIGYGGSWTMTQPVYISVNAGTSFFQTSTLPTGGNYGLFLVNRKTLLGQFGSRYLKLKITYNNPIGIAPISSQIPSQYSLQQNYPNPFNPVTKINFDIPKQGFASVKIYDALGRLISTVANENLKAGEYSVEWNASNYPSGVYFYSLQTRSFTETKKMVLVK